MQSLKEINDQVRTLQDASALPILAKARIIGCTTTGAAKYTSMLQDPKVAPAVVMVEEAGELLEIHALTSLSPKTKQLIMVSSTLLSKPPLSDPLAPLLPWLPSFPFLWPGLLTHSSSSLPLLADRGPQAAATQGGLLRPHGASWARAQPQRQSL